MADWSSWSRNNASRHPVDPNATSWGKHTIHRGKDTIEKEVSENGGIPNMDVFFDETSCFFSRKPHSNAYSQAENISNNIWIHLVSFGN